MSAVAHIDEYKTGRFYTDEFRGEMSWNGYEYNNLLRNEGCDEAGIPSYTDTAMALGADDIGDARGVAVFDYDNDGDLDLAINHNPGDNDHPGHGRAKLHENRVGERRSWLAVELTGTASNRDAVGALVTAQVGGESYTRLLTAGSSYASQHTQRLYFGLGDAEQVDRLTVRWPSGLVETLGPLPARHLLHWVEGEGHTLSRLEPARRPESLPASATTAAVQATQPTEPSP